MRERVAEVRAKKATEKGQQPWFQAVIIQYLGAQKWRLGLVPINGERAQWLEGLPYEEVVKRVTALEGRIKRVDSTTKEARKYE